MYISTPVDSIVQTQMTICNTHTHTHTHARAYTHIISRANNKLNEETDGVTKPTWCLLVMLICRKRCSRCYNGVNRAMLKSRSVVWCAFWPLPYTRYMLFSTTLAHSQRNKVPLEVMRALVRIPVGFGGLRMFGEWSAIGVALTVKKWGMVSHWCGLDSLKVGNGQPLVWPWQSKSGEWSAISVALTV